MSDKSPTTPTANPMDDLEFVTRVTRINALAKLCADETIYRANLLGDDRNTMLRSVIIRLQNAVQNAR